MTKQALPNTPTEAALAETFSAAQAKLPGNAVVAEQRAHAFEAFARTGLPNRRIEAWHYTDLRNLMRQALPLAAIPAAPSVRSTRTP